MDQVVCFGRKLHARDLAQPTTCNKTETEFGLSNRDQEEQLELKG